MAPADWTVLKDSALRYLSKFWALLSSSFTRLTSSSQSVIQRGCKNRKNEIDPHRKKHNLGKYHNLPYRHAGMMIDEVIVWECGMEVSFSREQEG